MMKNKIIFFVLSALFASPVFSEKTLSSKKTHYQFHQIIQEAFKTELVYSQEKGEVQLSLFPAFNRGHTEKEYALPFELEYGITDHWQVSFEADTYLINKSDEGHFVGHGDFGLGTLYSFYNINGTTNHAALMFQFESPEGNINKKLTEGFRVYEPSIALAHDFPSNGSQLFTQFGFDFKQRTKYPTGFHHVTSESVEEENGEEEEEVELEPEAHSVIFNLGYMIPIQNTHFVYVAEFNYENNMWNNNGETNAPYLTSGLVYTRKGYELSLGGSVGLSNSADKYQILANLIYEFDLA